MPNYFETKPMMWNERKNNLDREAICTPVGVVNSHFSEQKTAQVWRAAVNLWLHKWGMWSISTSRISSKYCTRIRQMFWERALWWHSSSEGIGSSTAFRAPGEVCWAVFALLPGGQEVRWQNRERQLRKLLSRVYKDLLVAMTNWKKNFEFPCYHSTTWISPSYIWCAL